MVPSARLQPFQRSIQLGSDLLSILMGTCFLALMAQISMPLWFTPVPLSLQSFAVLIIGASLGSKKGSLCVLTYLIEGLIGLPVFAAGSFGIASLLGPTGGYLAAFTGAAFIVGLILERKTASFSKIVFASLLAGAFILFAGSAWLSLFVGANHAFMLGALPFLLAEFTKSIAAACIVFFAKLSR